MKTLLLCLGVILTISVGNGQPVPQTHQVLHSGGTVSETETQSQDSQGKLIE